MAKTTDDLMYVWEILDRLNCGSQLTDEESSVIDQAKKIIAERYMARTMPALRLDKDSKELGRTELMQRIEAFNKATD